MKHFISLLLLVTHAALAQTIVCPSQAPARVKLAAKEIRRYVYLRTGKLLPMAQIGTGVTLQIEPALAAEEFRLQATGDRLSVCGGSDLGVLYGAYRYAELLGVRFYLHGDVIPDERLKELPKATAEISGPLFALRGVNPWTRQRDPHSGRDPQALADPSPNPECGCREPPVVPAQRKPQPGRDRPTGTAE